MSVSGGTLRARLRCLSVTGGDVSGECARQSSVLTTQLAVTQQRPPGIDSAGSLVRV